MSIGWLTTAWLSYIVSESDHRMVEVETWAKEHIETLSALIPIPEAVDVDVDVDVKDFTKESW